MLDTVAAAIEEIAAGRPVLVIDDEDRENEGDLIAAGSLMTPVLMAFLIRHSGGIVCAAMEGPDLDRLHLPPMVALNEDPRVGAFTVSVDAADGTTGISAASRANTLRLLADPGTGPRQLQRPGHVFPLRADEGGLAARQGHTEAGIELVRLAGLPPVAALTEVFNPDGTLARLPELRVFADEHGLALISIEQLMAHRAAVPAGV
ncbi:3,4-dihydroxy-2-butanone-4-phosphate synthase [Acrocarpospora sp. B8E8]|uniref:3,4-dihydroxy-2-butanone-4-phosphate synthase n=1 Tax=Acrocarpospora sp. B8E8 TaxID=3153572 RepID=UPI00325F7699